MDSQLTRRSVIILIGIGLIVSLAIWFLLVKTSVIKTRSESLLIYADSPCIVNVDGDEIKILRPGSLTVTVTAGQHLVSAVSLEENVVWEDLIHVPKGKEITVPIRLSAKVTAAKQKRDPLRVE